ncbi:hypothetical protein F5B20DRAFT_420996 [Whalleya microplaca]|nr:hypothetical protein F5B20DRAFT_420996 [Whalleya microplaca]
MAYTQPSPISGARLPAAGRHRGLYLAAAMFVTGIAVGVRYQRSALTRNEQAQKSAAENLYVSVDRSGGGI